MFDLLIRGGLVVDGTGLPGRPADVGITDGTITAIGRLPGAAAQQTIDADGLVVAPGIVDAHTHYDPQITWDPLCDTSALHGVTTVAAGNCGFSVAPCRQDDHAYLAQMFARVEGMDLAALDHIGFTFETFGEYLATRPGTLGINLGMYVGHSAIRRWVLGEEAYEREATDTEIKQLAALVDEAMAAGALGFSSSHAPTHLDLADRPVPSRLASLDELRALADAVGIHARGSIAYAPGQRRRGHRRQRPRAAHRAGRSRRRAGHHPGSGRPVQGRRPQQGVGAVARLSRQLRAARRTGLLAAHDPRVQRSLLAARRHLPL